MRRISKAILRAFDYLVNYMALLAAIGFIYIIVTVCYEIIARKLGHPTLWVLDFAQIALVYITFLGAAWVLRENKHVVIDILVDKLSPYVNALLGILISLICSIACWFLVAYGVIVTINEYQKGYFIPSVIEIPTFIVLLIVPIGSLLLAIQFLRRGWKYYQRLRSQEIP